MFDYGLKQDTKKKSQICVYVFKNRRIVKFIPK